MKKPCKVTTALVFLLLFSTILGGCNEKLVPDPSQPADSLPNASTTQTLEWKEIQPGLAYANLAVPKKLMIVKIDPTKYQFNIYQNQDEKNAKSIKEIHKEQGSLVTFNGSFFDENFKPLGLLVDQGRQIHELSKSELMDGIFVIASNKTPSVHFKQNFTLSPGTLFAMENGPILIDEQGEIQTKRDTGKTAARTALGLDSENNILVMVLEQNLLQSDNTLSLYEFAHLLREAPLLRDIQIHSVLNLDGGKSTGLMVDDIYVPEVNIVQNVVIVRPLP